MAHEYSISDFGLKLIKAYEGFRPVETVLVSGQRVIGYGHHYVPGEVSVLTKKKASDLLKSDLEPIEDMINHIVFAPLSQSQFDALVSLTFNIGAEEFADSSVLHYLNNGQPLAAAAGFDAWRKSEIVGKTYVVDALVRRRTAEKALFLSPSTGVVAAPRSEIPPINDSAAPSGADDIEVFSKSDARGYVDQTPYAVNQAQRRRKEDSPPGVLTLSERYYDAEKAVDDTPWVEDDISQSAESIQDTTEASEKLASDKSIDDKTDKKLSPIAVAAAEVSERLDNLMADEPGSDTLDLADKLSEDDVKTTRMDRPNLTLVETDDVELDVIDDDKLIEDLVHKTDETANEISSLEVDDRASANDVQDTKLERNIRGTSSSTHDPDTANGIGAYWTALVVGLTLLGGGLWKLKFSPVQKLDEMSAFLAPVAMLVGAMMIMGGLYYLFKAQLRDA